MELNEVVKTVADLGTQGVMAIVIYFLYKAYSKKDEELTASQKARISDARTTVNMFVKLNKDYDHGTKNGIQGMSNLDGTDS